MTDSTGPGNRHEAGGAGPTKTVPVRHPGRWVASAVILVLVAMLVNTLLFSHVVRGGVRVPHHAHRLVVHLHVRGAVFLRPRGAVAIFEVEDRAVLRERFVLVRMIA